MKGKIYLTAFMSLCLCAALLPLGACTPSVSSSTATSSSSEESVSTGDSSSIPDSSIEENETSSSGNTEIEPPQDDPDDPDAPGLHFSRIGNVYKVTGMGYGYDEDVVVPAEHNGLPVTIIGSYAFSGFNGLKSVTLPDCVTDIQNHAFSRCPDLEKINMPLGVKTFVLPNFQECPSLKEIAVPENHSVFSTQDSVLYNKQKTYLVYAPPGIEGTITIPQGIQKIGENEFEGCSSLTGVILPDSVTTIERGAFSACRNLETVRIPDSLTYIARNAFVSDVLQYNEYEGGLYLGNETNPYVLLMKVQDATQSTYTMHPKTKLIGPNVFAINNNLTHLTLPDSVIFIGNGAFYGTENIESLVIPTSLRYADSYAFTGLGGNIYYKGTKTQWNNITFEWSVAEEIVYYYSVNEPTDSGQYWHYVDGIPVKW